MSLRSERKLTEINRYFFFSQNGQFPHFRLQSVAGDERDVQFPNFSFLDDFEAWITDGWLVGRGHSGRIGV